MTLTIFALRFLNFAVFIVIFFLLHFLLIKRSRPEIEIIFLNLSNDYVLWLMVF